MALSENNRHTVSPRDIVRNWGEFLGIIKPPPSPETVVFLATGAAPKTLGIVERRPFYHLDMPEQSTEGQLYLWQEEKDNKDLREILFLDVPEVVIPAPAARVEAKPRQSPHISTTPALGLR